MRRAQRRINRVGLAALKIEICHIAIDLVGGGRGDAISMYTESERLEAGRSREDHIIFAAIITEWHLVGVVVLVRITAALSCESSVNEKKEPPSELSSP